MGQPADLHLLLAKGRMRSKKGAQLYLKGNICLWLKSYSSIYYCCWADKVVWTQRTTQQTVLKSAGKFQCNSYTVNTAPGSWKQNMQLSALLLIHASSTFSYNDSLNARYLHSLCSQRLHGANRQRRVTFLKWQYLASHILTSFAFCLWIIHEPDGMLPKYQ